MFEILEHTADIGFRACAATLEGLFVESARALVSVVVDLDSIRPQQTRMLSASGEDNESLLVNWLNEVLYRLDGERLALTEVRRLEVKGNTVHAEAAGEEITAGRHHVKLIVKGVTYHQLRIRHDGRQWCADVFLDI